MLTPDVAGLQWNKLECCAGDYNKELALTQALNGISFTGMHLTVMLHYSYGSRHLTKGQTNIERVYRCRKFAPQQC